MANEVMALEAQGKFILRKKSNHVLIPPTIFLMIDSESNVRSKDLVLNTIKAIRIDLDKDNKRSTHRKEEEAKGMELTLAILWASENNGLTLVNLSNVQGHPTLNQLISTSIKGKLKANRNEEGNEGREGRTGKAAAWALSSQSIVQELNRIQESHKAEKSLQASIKSLLAEGMSIQRNFDPSFEVSKWSN
jgi:hypothetical protein